MPCLVYHKTIPMRKSQLTVFRDFFQNIMLANFYLLFAFKFPTKFQYFPFKYYTVILVNDLFGLLQDFEILSMNKEINYVRKGKETHGVHFYVHVAKKQQMCLRDRII